MTISEATRQILKKLRKDAGFPRQKDFDAHLGKGRDWTARRESGAISPTVDDLDTWAAGCDVEPYKLIKAIAVDMSYDRD